MTTEDTNYTAPAAAPVPVQPPAPAVACLFDDLPNDSAVLSILKHGGTEETGWKITFAGPAHPQTIEWTNEQSRKNAREEANIKQAQVNGRKYKAEEISPEESRRNTVMWIVSRILSWTPVQLERGGPVIEFSREAALKIFLDPRFANYFNQCVDFLVAERSFIKGSAKT